MRVLIAGAGRVGSHLAKRLVSEGHEVVVVDKDEERCARLSAEVDALVIRGDVVSISVLSEAGVDRADAVVAVTGEDQVNILTCLIAKEFGVRKTIARVSDLRLARIAERLGVQRTVTPEIVTAEHIATLIGGALPITEVLVAGEGFKLLSVPIHPASPAVGRRLGELPKHADWVVVAVQEDDRLVQPTNDYIFKEGDKIIVLARSEAVGDVKRFFSR